MSLVLISIKYTKMRLYDYTTKKTDPSKRSFSSTFFLQPSNGNVVSGWTPAVYNGIASAILASVSAANGKSASFSGFSSNKWLDKVSYVGAFKNGSDWTAGWTNFDPQNTVY